MKFDIDRFREILDTITRNKSRSFLTGFGIFWGVFMLVALLGGGQGLKELLQNNFEGFATNAAIIFPQNTTKPYAGFRKGRPWCMVYDDVERLRQYVPELATVSPTLSHWGGNAINGDKKTNCIMKGLRTVRCASSARRCTRTCSPRAATPAAREYAWTIFITVW